MIVVYKVPTEGVGSKVGHTVVVHLLCGKGRHRFTPAIPASHIIRGRCYPFSQILIIEKAIFILRTETSARL